MRRQMIGWWVMVAVLAVSTPAVAHVTTDIPLDFTPAPLETLTDGGPSMDGLGPLVAGIAAALTLIGRRRRAVAVACMALLLLVAFESAVHSVHHLADQPGGHCVIASASAHASGIAVDTVALGRPAETLTVVGVAPIVFPAARPAAPDLGRAPPVA
jgi:hypothetical protein